MEDVDMKMEYHSRKSVEKESGAHSAYGLLDVDEMEKSDQSSSMALWFSLILFALIFGGAHHDV